jgi:hypothetical protein
MVQSKRREEFAINVSDIVGHNKDRRQFGKAASFAEATTLGSKYQMRRQQTLTALRIFPSNALSL